eukprot:1609902-Pleurochrysis_carterae.AAC.2
MNARVPIRTRYHRHVHTHVPALARRQGSSRAHTDPRTCTQARSPARSRAPQRTRACTRTHSHAALVASWHACMDVDLRFHGGEIH